MQTDHHTGAARKNLEEALASIHSALGRMETGIDVRFGKLNQQPIQHEDANTVKAVQQELQQLREASRLLKIENKALQEKLARLETQEKVLRGALKASSAKVEMLISSVNQLIENPANQ